jgi:hypothetical protein
MCYEHCDYGRSHVWYWSCWWIKIILNDWLKWQSLEFMFWRAWSVSTRRTWSLSRHYRYSPMLMNSWDKFTEFWEDLFMECFGDLIYFMSLTNGKLLFIIIAEKTKVHVIRHPISWLGKRLDLVIWKQSSSQWWCWSWQCAAEFTLRLPNARSGSILVSSIPT